MLCGVDLCRLFDGTVVQPEHDISVIVKFWASHGNGLVSVVGEDGKGAGSIKCQTSNGSGVNVVLIEDTVDRGTDTTPDVICRLLLDAIVSSRSS